jgi:hypothetical protein
MLFLLNCLGQLLHPEVPLHFEIIVVVDFFSYISVFILLKIFLKYHMFYYDLFITKQF